MPRRSIGGPLAIGIVSMVLVLALAVGWQILVWRDDAQPSSGLSTLDTLLFVLGSLFFLFVFAGLVWLCVKLVLEMRLSQTQRAFLDAVTHELKTPLASFRLGLETLDRHELEPGKRSEFLGRMSQDLDRLEHTVTQVLAAARAEESRPVRAGWGDVDLQDLLAACVRELIERHGLDEDAVRVDRVRSLRVRGDEAELGVVFRNLFERRQVFGGSDSDPRRHRRGRRRARPGRDFRSGHRHSEAGARPHLQSFLPHRARRAAAGIRSGTRTLRRACAAP